MGAPWMTTMRSGKRQIFRMVVMSKFDKATAQWGLLRSRKIIVARIF
jgi:hypothetical protein